jgi:N-acetyltransferase
MDLKFQQLTARFVRLEPFAESLEEEIRAAIDCDPETWAIMPINAMGKGFDDYWRIACAHLQMTGWCTRSGSGRMERL